MKKNRIYISFLSNTKLDIQSSGGIITLIKDTLNYLNNEGQELYFISNSSPLKNEMGKINYIKCIDFLLSIRKFCLDYKFNNKLIVFGCARPWAYFAVVFTLIFGFKVFWCPCYHPSKFVENKLNAKIAKFLILFFSNLDNKNLKIICLTKFESEVIGLKKKNTILGIMANLKNGQNYLKNKNLSFENFKKRRYKLTFIGRATSQKGWDKFLEMVSLLPKEEMCCAVLSSKYHKEIIAAKRKYQNLFILSDLSEDELLEILRETVIFYLPSNYESLGISHIEAVLQGCFVPLLGRYPFWDNSNISTKEDLNILKTFVTNNNLYDKAYKNLLSKIEFLEEKQLIKSFEITMQKIIKA